MMIINRCLLGASTLISVGCAFLNLELDMGLFQLKVGLLVASILVSIGCQILNL